jgi:hypothetical protein
LGGLKIIKHHSDFTKYSDLKEKKVLKFPTDNISTVAGDKIFQEAFGAYCASLLGELFLQVEFIKKAST